MDDRSLGDWERIFAGHLVREIELSPQRSAAHLPDHSKRVWARAKALCEEVGAGPQTMVAACYLHDLGRHHGLAVHGLKSAELAAPILEAEGFPKDKAEEALDAIAKHDYQTPAADRESPAAKLLFDCDKMDAFGAIGVKRYVLYFWCANNPLPPIRDVIDDNLMLKWKSLHYKRSREMAKDDFDYIVGFFERLGRELDGG